MRQCWRAPLALGLLVVGLHGRRTLGNRARLSGTALATKTCPTTFGVVLWPFDGRSAMLDNTDGKVSTRFTGTASADQRRF